MFFSTDPPGMQSYVVRIKKLNAVFWPFLYLGQEHHFETVWYLLILGTEAQDGLKAWCDNNSWFCDCTDGGQLDDLFDDVGNFTEVNTGKIVLFGISQITTMRLLVEIG